MTFDHNTFISPFTWRYGSPAMRHIWSETRKRQLMRQVWVALAAAQHQAGLVTNPQLADLQANINNINIARAEEIEQETRHDVMAEIRTYAEQCPIGGGVIHWGATSEDIGDNVYALRIREAAAHLTHTLRQLLLVLAEKIEATAEIPVMAHTHIQPAEPTTLGYRLAVYAQDLLADYEELNHLATNFKGKGLKGAVGTQASYHELLHGTGMSAEELEKIAMNQLHLPYFLIATQTYTRQQDVRLMNILAGIASSLHKWAMDFRILQSPPFGEWSEPFGKHQVGSSAMPFKRNPITMENICSLARYVAALPAMAWDNASQAILERSLDDSANRRLFIAEGFLAVDEMLLRMVKVAQDMRLNETIMARNMAVYGPFAATERVLMALVAAGASRQDGHEWLRSASLQAWEAIQQGQPNPLVQLLAHDEQILAYLTAAQVQNLMAAEAHVGTAPGRARQLAHLVQITVH